MLTPSISSSMTTFPLASQSPVHTNDGGVGLAVGVDVGVWVIVAIGSVEVALATGSAVSVLDGVASGMNGVPDDVAVHVAVESVGDVWVGDAVGTTVSSFTGVTVDVERAAGGVAV